MIRQTYTPYELKQLAKQTGPKWSCEEARAALCFAANAMDAADTAVQQSIKGIALMMSDAARIDWLADESQNIGNVQLPTACVLANLASLRGAIDMAMEMDAEITEEQP